MIILKALSEAKLTEDVNERLDVLEKHLTSQDEAYSMEVMNIDVKCIPKTTRVKNSPAGSYEEVEQFLWVAIVSWEIVNNDKSLMSKIEELC